MTGLPKLVPVFPAGKLDTPFGKNGTPFGKQGSSFGKPDTLFRKPGTPFWKQGGNHKYPFLNKNGSLKKPGYPN